jgi:hypothetical protein
MAYRGFVVKTFNSEVQFPEFLKSFEDVNYACSAVLEESGFPPLQKGYIHFSKKVTLSSLLRKHPNLDWSPSVGSGEDNRSKINIGINFWETGELPVCPIPRKRKQQAVSNEMETQAN